MTALAGWQNFYVIAGSSAGALIGLQFVVLSLIANRPRGENSAGAGHAFGTPTVVHFGAVLALSSVLCAPWAAIGPVATVWGIGGLSGVVYAIIVIRRVRAQSAYKPEFEDWLFHVVLPFAAYAALGVSACFALSNPYEALFAVAAAALLLLFIGIHNAWDAVTYHVYSRRKKDEQQC